MQKCFLYRVYPSPVLMLFGRSLTSRVWLGMTLNKYDFFYILFYFYFLNNKTSCRRLVPRGSVLNPLTPAPSTSDQIGLVKCWKERRQQSSHLPNIFPKCSENESPCLSIRNIKICDRKNYLYILGYRASLYTDSLGQFPKVDAGVGYVEYEQLGYLILTPVGFHSKKFGS